MLQYHVFIVSKLVLRGYLSVFIRISFTDVDDSSMQVFLLFLVLSFLIGHVHCHTRKPSVRIAQNVNTR